MEWLNKAEKVFKEKERRNVQVYMRKSWRMKHYTQENKILETNKQKENSPCVK